MVNRYKTKKSLASLITTEIQIKTTVKIVLHTVRMAVINKTTSVKMWKRREHLHISGNIN